MPRPVLRTNLVEATNLKNKTKHCTIVLPAEYLSANIRKGDVAVTHEGRAIVVQSAKAVQNAAGNWFLIIRTKEIPRTHFGDSEEIEITVTNPDTGETSNPPTEVEVVYFDEETYVTSRPTAKATRRTGKASRPAMKKAKRQAPKKNKKKAKR